MYTKTIAGIIIVLSVAMGLSSTWNESPVVDEVPHIGAGYSYITQGSYIFNPEHPPLAKDLAGITLALLDLDQSAFSMPHPGYWPTDIHGEWNFGRNLIFNSGNDAMLVTRVARMPLLLFFVLSALIIFIWTRKLYGDKASLIALFLFCMSPTILAHGRLVTTDVAALFGVLLSSYFFVKFIQNQTKINLVLAGLAFGVAQLTKFSLVLIIPLFFLIAIIWGASHKNWSLTVKSLLLTAVMMIIGVVTIVWPTYALHVQNDNPQTQRADAIDILKDFGYDSQKNPTLMRKAADLTIWASDKPVIRSLSHYALGVLMVIQRNAGGNTTYFFGHINFVGSMSYFPLVYFIKEPLSFWGLMLIGLAGLLYGFKKFKFDRISSWSKNHIGEITMVLWLAIYWYTSLTAHLNIGVRHLIPTFGFVYILLSGQIAQILEILKYKKKALAVFVTMIFLLLGWYLVENLNVFPYYLTYFNQTVGGPTGGHRYVVDSNLDWGQDLKRLGDWAEINNIDKVNLDYFGWSDPRYYLGDKYAYTSGGMYKSAEEFLKAYPLGGHLAISATFYMQSRYDQDKFYAWLDAYTPVVTIGNSILVWHIPSR